MSGRRSGDITRSSQAKAHKRHAIMGIVRNMGGAFLLGTCWKSRVDSSGSRSLAERAPPPPSTT